MPPIPSNNADNQAAADTAIVADAYDLREPGLDPESLADAEHLDKLEASEEFADIASFEEVDLPPPDDSHKHGNDDTESVTSQSAPGEGARRAKRYYYFMPIVQKYKYHMLGCLMAIVVIGLAVGLIVSAPSGPNKASASQLAGGENGFGEGVKPQIHVDDAPQQSDFDYVPYDEELPPYPYDSQQEGDEEVGEVMEHTIDGNQEDEWEEGIDDRDEEVGDPEVHTVTDPPTDAPRPDSPVSAPASSPSSSSAGAGSSSTDGTSPSETSPLWFETSHAQYQSFVASHAEIGVDVHPYDLAGLFCHSQALSLCTYEQYCPDGQGGEPYGGGPPGISYANELKRMQWAPILTEAVTSSNKGDENRGWVQVGQVTEDDGGSEENHFGSCWTYQHWTLGKNGVDASAFVAEGNRRWMLCCPPATNYTRS